MRYSDKPIDRPSLDLLGRSSFALSLARAIDTLAVAKDGFVIAIQGEWGSGKTSLIEMVCRYLRHVEMERASNEPARWETEAHPKSINELEEMAEIFERVEPVLLDLDQFYKYQGGVRTERDARWKELRRYLESDDEADIADRYWRLQQQAEQGAHTIIVRFSPWLISGRAELSSALLTDLARAIGEQLGDDIRRAFGTLLTRLSEFAPVVGAGLDVTAHGLGIGALTRAGSALTAKIGEKITSGPTLDQLRVKLQTLLGKLIDKKVLVIVDDLDRLTPSEALEIVSIVKSLGDLPNVVYILSGNCILYNTGRLCPQHVDFLRSRGFNTPASG